ncbi:hypothetical protein NON20_13520 [Synechocystis sp. B12]|nr:hypothetical protein NON20_13520 [Synechocystis sp. B12]
MVLQKLKLYDQAIIAYQDALALDNKFIDSYISLADLFISIKKPEEVIKNYILALKINSNDSILFKKLAKAYQQINDDANYYLSLANAAFIDTNYLVAVENFEQYFAIVSTGSIDFYLKFYKSYIQIDQAEKAIAILENHALIDFPDSLMLQRANQAILPIVYETEQEVNFYRQRFIGLLDGLVSRVNVEPPNQNELIQVLAHTNNFLLPYQNENDLEVNRKYAYFLHTIVQSLFPQWSVDRKYYNKSRHDKIRIGYISLRLHNLGKLYLNWIKEINHDKFANFIYDISGKKADKLSDCQQKIKSSVDKYAIFPRTPNIHDLCEVIIADDLDILILPEIGIDPIYNVLSLLRLAPVQCTTWAHPITSGSPAIDYFLSSELMEPPNGEEHYSEKLIKLPNLAFSLNPIELPVLNKVRSDFQMRENAVIYLCCQSLFKYLPRHDYIFAAIAERVKNSQFVFLDAGQGPIFTAKFKKRMERAFAEYDLNYQEHCIFLARREEDKYLMLYQLADIFLDCLTWSGGFTTQEAIVSGLPVVTCPGQFMRARHSHGILQMLGVTETIAQTENEYIEIAVGLGLDSRRRAMVSDKIKSHQNRIFGDRKCLQALENFFEHAVATAT